jgi:hypothetical protein
MHGERREVSGADPAAGDGDTHDQADERAERDQDDADRDGTGLREEQPRALDRVG